MIRGRIPGGRLGAAQYLAWDAIADRFGDGSLRLTTRQGLELHGVVKGEARATLQALREALQTTQGACGDVVRNVTQAPNPWGRADLAQLDALADLLSGHFQARSHAYAEIWLDGEAVPPEGEAEPLYGDTYLPRKFKIALTVVGENLVDLHTHDLAFAATFDGEGRLEGWFTFAGGGMGMTHNNPATYPRLGDLLGWIPATQLLPVAEAVVAAHRDLGHRGDRKQARLKYVVAKLGVEAFRAEVEGRSGIPFAHRPLPPWNTSSVLGWLARTDGSWAYGLHTPSGRIQGALKEALRDLVSGLGLNLQLSPDQDLILLGIRPEDRERVAGRLAAAGAREADPLTRRALACVALPFCGLAVAEAERALPELLAPLRESLAAHGRLDQAPVFRVAGCANGCSRPYAAELALVGQAPGKYVLFAGGNAEGTRLAFPLREKVRVEELPQVFDTLVATWVQLGLPGEPLGDFAHRLGAGNLRQRLGGGDA